MPPKTKKKDELVPQPQNKPVGSLGMVTKLLESRKDFINQVLPKGMTADRFLAGTYLSCRRNPNLLQCTDTSWIEAALLAAELGLIPDGRHAGLIPYGKEVKLIPMWMGMQAIAYRKASYPSVVKINTQLVYQGDDWTVDLANGKLVHERKFATSNVDHVLFAYCLTTIEVCESRDFETILEVMSIDELQAIKARALEGKKNPKASPWNTDTAEMYRKTVFKRAWKRYPSDEAMALTGTLVADADMEPIEGEFTVVNIEAEAPVKSPNQRTEEIAENLGKQKKSAGPKPAPKPTPTPPPEPEPPARAAAPPPKPEPEVEPELPEEDDEDLFGGM